MYSSLLQWYSTPIYFSTLCCSVKIFEEHGALDYSWWNVHCDNLTIIPLHYFVFSTYMFLVLIWSPKIMTKNQYIFNEEICQVSSFCLLWGWETSGEIDDVSLLWCSSAATLTSLTPAVYLKSTTPKSWEKIRNPEIHMKTLQLPYLESLFTAFLVRFF